MLSGTQARYDDDFCAFLNVNKVKILINI
jgi:hypothetical protein